MDGGYQPLISILEKDGFQRAMEIYSEDYKGIVERLLYSTNKHDRKLQISRYRNLWKGLIEQLEKENQSELTRKALYTLGLVKKSKFRKIYEDVTDHAVLGIMTILSWGNLDSGYYFEKKLEKHYANRDINKVRSLLFGAQHPL